MSNKIENTNIHFISKFFPTINNIDLNKIKITTEGKYSISDIKSSQILVTLIKKLFKTNEITITDATANNGSDTIKLALEFKKINSIEIDKINYKVLKNNIDVYNLQNVNLFYGNSLDIISTLKQDIIYIDAPWGGINYKENNRLLLYLDKMELSDIYNNYKIYTKLFIFKVPFNYDFTYFIQKTFVSKYNIILYSKNNNKKFYFFFVSVK